MILLLFLITINSSLSSPKSVTRNGMTVEWTFINKQEVKFKLTTPTRGWAAIGLNVENSLVGSNLIMAAATCDSGIVSDRFVLALGNHKAVEELNISSQVKLSSATENNTGTTIEFTLNTKKSDAYHYALRAGDTLYLTMAYAHEDDFQHHSAMRTALSIIL